MRLRCAPRAERAGTRLVPAGLLRRGYSSGGVETPKMCKLGVIGRLCFVLLAGLVEPTSGLATESDLIELASGRTFDDTVQHLQWSFGGFGLTTVTAMDYQQILKKIKFQTGRAVMFEVMRRDWAKTLLKEDPALGIILPMRVYVFERPDGTTIVSYRRPGSLLETHQSEEVRKFGRILDMKLQSITGEATMKPREQPQ